MKPDYFDLMKAITYAHVEAQGLKVSASTLPASGARPNTLADEGEVHASVASPSEILPTAEANSASAIHGIAVSGNGAGTANSAPKYLLSAEIVDKVYSKERIDFEMRLLHRTREEL